MKYLMHHLSFLGMISIILIILYFITINNIEILPAYFAWNKSSIFMPIYEVLICFFVSVLIFFLNTKSKILIIISLLPLYSAYIVYILQVASIYISGDFISILALENISEYRYLPDSIVLSVLTILILLGITFICYSILLLKNRIKVNFKKLYKINLSITIIFSIIIILFYNYNLKLSPFTSLLHKIYNGYNSCDEILDIDQLINYNKYFSSDKKLNLGLGMDSEYPLHQTVNHIDKLPFNKTKKDKIPPNLILIFAEGFPARTMKSYGSSYTDLTPRLDSYINNFMVVENYFNHTAATFRGIQGSLTSQYPYPGGHMPGGWTEPNKISETIASRLNGINRQSLVKILKNFDYNTYFLSPHPQKNILNNMLEGLGFDRVYTEEDYSNILGFDNQFTIFNKKKSIADRDIFKSLREIVKSTYDLNKSNFISMYNVGTHAFLDSHHKGLRYLDGTNAALNRFHEFDYSIGIFLDFFFNSDISNNTILVITSDHSAHPEPAVRKAFDNDKDYEPFIVDNIPLLIYSPFHELPPKYNANGKTSLDLSPTIISFLELNNYDHSFMGKSLFSTYNSNGPNIAALGNEYYSIDNANIVSKIDLDNVPKKYEFYINLIKASYRLESENKLFNVDSSYSFPK